MLLGLVVLGLLTHIVPLPFSGHTPFTTSTESHGPSDGDSEASHVASCDATTARTAPTVPAPAVTIAVAAKQMKDFGGMLSFQVRGGKDEALGTAARLRLILRATSLGGPDTLIEHRASIEPPDKGTPQNLLRLSVGLEHPEDLIEDLEQALA